MFDGLPRGAPPHHGWLVLRIQPGFELLVEAEGVIHPWRYMGPDREDSRLLVFSAPGGRTLVLDWRRPVSLIDGFWLAGHRAQRHAISLHCTPAARKRVSWSHPNT